MGECASAFWSTPAPLLLSRLQTAPHGLTTEEARRRQPLYASARLHRKKRIVTLSLLFAQFKSPIVLILIFAAGLALLLGEPTDALIILTIIFISAALGFWQERGATEAVDKLLAIVQIKADVMRDGRRQEIPVEEVVPGDIIVLSAGGSIPGDCLLLDSKDLFVDEATLTGETYPVEKIAGILPADRPLAQRTNSLFLGTHVVSGSAQAVVVTIGTETEFGKVSHRLAFAPPETEFERGVRRFGYLLLEVTLILVIAIFAVNVYLARPVLDSFLFSLALAVGLTPQLLPAIISINLAHGAKRMADHGVIVKRLASIENFGSMNVFCSDKTGTLTEGRVRLHAALDACGKASEKVLLFASLNAAFETGFLNPIDEAIRTHRSFDLSSYRKLDEEPYDFVRKRLSILISAPDTRLIITKGALPNVLDVCESVETPAGPCVAIASCREEIQQQAEALSGQGYRILGVAYREVPAAQRISKDDEMAMIFLGLLVFFDPPKLGIPETLSQLRRLGITLKIITGDSRLVARHVSQQVGLLSARILTGSDLRQMSDEALLQQVNEVQVFAEVEPNQKERIIRALRKTGNVVGYGGDGINDASALHAADVGISVDSAVDVAKEAADIVLLEKDLGVLVQGVREGRTTFANTLKYVFMATSANFGNMFSMAGASLFLPFLPLLPKQILLTNLLTDVPEMTIATDRVDREWVDRPRRWDIPFIRRFMLTFGLISSVFDYLTFVVLLLLLQASMDQFRAGWFVESVISASVIVLVIRTRKPFFKSWPGRYLLLATLLIGVATLLIPLSPVGKVFGFASLPASFLAVLGLIVALYVLTAEVAKKLFYAKVSV